MTVARCRIVGPGEGREFRIPGVRVSARAQSAGGVATPLHSADQEAERAVAQAQGDIPTLSVTTGGTGGDAHQSDPARVGELLRERAFEPVFWLCSRLGGEEDTAAPDARARNRRGFGWKRWSTKWLYKRLGLYGNYYRVRWPPATGKALPTGSAT